MRPLYSDPDFTGSYTSVPNAIWRITRDQWYCIIRIFMREYLRAHIYRIDASSNEVDDKELEYEFKPQIRAHVGAMIEAQGWNGLPWGSRIPWNIVACYAFYRGLQSRPGGYWAPHDEFGSWLEQGLCPVDIRNDYTYGSGLLIASATLDPVHPYGDVVNAMRYEAACDAIEASLFNTYKLAQGTPTPVQGTSESGSAYRDIELPPPPPPPNPQNLPPAYPAKTSQWGPIVALGAVGVLVLGAILVMKEESYG